MSESRESTERIEGIAREAGVAIADRVDLAGRAPVFAPLADAVDPALRALIDARCPAGAYAHQVRAIESVVAGQDICLSTATASGKSLVFMAAAADRLRRDPEARVLALYPAKALIQDQLGKWQTLLADADCDAAVARIDGQVPMAERIGLLRGARVILMTPDVLHAWMLSRLDEAPIREFLAALRLLVLDEAHVYEGVFGTNMAYLLRRLEVAAAEHRLVVATATLGDPEGFCRRLTGRRVRSFGPADDTAACPDKIVLLGRPGAGRPLDVQVALLRGLAASGAGRFLAFGDSRRAVELLVAALERDGGAGDGHRPVLPYRAGYEDADRQAIQAALGNGGLAGVVATSALELGLDIGAIDTVVLLGVPPSNKAFWQRLGRAGRRAPGVCLLLDDRRLLPEAPGTLDAYLGRPLEPSHLYLDNRYIQFANALCAGRELESLGLGSADAGPFDSLPAGFRAYLDNELDPTEALPADLLPMRQLAQAGPHREFPLRCGIEQSFRVLGPHEAPLGRLTHGQMLREAYPGAVYYYMARPYRVIALDYRRSTIRVRPERRITTRPHQRTRVFPRFAGGTLALRSAPDGFLAEADLQVGERVTGFVEQRGSKRSEHSYETGSPFYPRPVGRFFETTGVCLGRDGRPPLSEAAADTIRRAFCIRSGAHGRELGVGRFSADHGPGGRPACKGICIFDAVSGSLRLTERLIDTFPEVLAAAVDLADEEDAPELAAELTELRDFAAALEPERVDDSGRVEPLADGDWVVVVAPGEPAVYFNGNGPEEVRIEGHRYSPQGLLYDLTPSLPGTRWTVTAERIQPMAGRTRLQRVNLVSGETAPLD